MTSLLNKESSRWKNMLHQFLNIALWAFSSMKQWRQTQCCSAHTSGRQFIRRHKAPERELLQLHIQPGCCLWDTPWQPPSPFNSHWSDQAPEPDLPLASRQVSWTQASPSINSPQKWYPTTPFPSSLPFSAAPAHSLLKSNKQLRRDQQDKPGWVLPYWEAQVMSTCSGVELYINSVKPSVHQLYC